MHERARPPRLNRYFRATATQKRIAKRTMRPGASNWAVEAKLLKRDSVETVEACTAARGAGAVARTAAARSPEPTSRGPHEKDLTRLLASGVGVEALRWV